MEQFIKLSAADKVAFEANGYVIVKSLYTKNEIDLLMQAAENDQVIRRIPMAEKTRMETLPNWLYGIFLAIIFTACLPDRGECTTEYRYC